MAIATEIVANTSTVLLQAPASTTYAVIGMLYFGTKLRYYMAILGGWGGLVILAGGLTLLL